MVSNLKPAELMDSQEEEYQTLVSAQSRLRNLPLASEVPLHNRYNALALKQGEGVNNSNGNGTKAPERTKKTHTHKKKTNKKRRCW